MRLHQEMSFIDLVIWHLKLNSHLTNPSVTVDCFYTCHHWTAGHWAFRFVCYSFKKCSEIIWIIYSWSAHRFTHARFSVCLTAYCSHYSLIKYYSFFFILVTFFNRTISYLVLRFVRCAFPGRWMAKRSTFSYNTI